VDLQRVSEPGLVASALGGVPDRCGNHRVPPRSEHRSPGPNQSGEVELCDLWWPDGPRLRRLNQVERCIAWAIGRKP